MKDHSFMSRYGDKLVANGYAILPLQPGAKKPGRYIRGKWIDYSDWTRHAARGNLRGRSRRVPTIASSD